MEIKDMDMRDLLDEVERNARMEVHYETCLWEAREQDDVDCYTRCLRNIRKRQIAVRTEIINRVVRK